MALPATFPTNFRRGRYTRPVVCDSNGVIEPIILSTASQGGLANILVSRALNTASIATASTNCVAIGRGATISAGTGATAVGSGAVCTNDSAVSVGFGATSAFSATAIGQGASATFAQSCSIGPATCPGPRCVAVGNLATAGNGNANQNDVAIGVSASAPGLRCVAIGDTASATNSSCVAVGPSTVCSTNSFGTAVGHGAVVSGLNGVAIGGASVAPFTTASATSATAIGDGIQNSLANSVALGAAGIKYAHIHVPVDVSQGTSNDTTVVTNQYIGTITMFAAITAGNAHRFTVTNSRVNSLSHIQLTVRGRSTNKIPTVASVDTVGSGSFTICVYNPDAAAPTLAVPVIHFWVLIPT